MPQPITYRNLASLLGIQSAPPNPGVGWVGPEKLADTWAEMRQDPFTTLADLVTGLIAGQSDQPGRNAQNLGALLSAAAPAFAAVKAARATGTAATAAEEAAQGIRAYHGSPHDFDKFDLSKIGTGEGAQAYGHGLYFAQDEGVAKTYRDALKWRGSNWDDPAVIAGNVLEANGGDVQKAINQLETANARNAGFKGQQAGNEARTRAIGLLRERGKVASSDNPGRMYEVQINANPDHLLDWDKPLSEQSEPVRQKLRDAWIAHPDVDQAKTGAQIYRSNGVTLTGKQGTEAAAESLKQAGIPGIKYLDGASRAAGEGSRNYVIFDDALVSILKKYGVALPVIEGLRRQANANGGKLPQNDVARLVNQ